MLNATRLRCEYLESPMGIDFAQPRLTWLPVGDSLRQTAYQIIAVCGPRRWDSGKVLTAQTAHIPCQLPLQSRDRVTWQVRLWDENDTPGDWTEASFEMGLLQPGDWQAVWIDPEDYEPDPDTEYPASALRKRFTLDAIGTARIYLSACGTYAAWLNGQRIGEDVLTPGTTEYEKRIQYQTYDVTALLQPGENELVAFVGDGWFRGSKGMGSRRNIFGTHIAFLAQLEMDGRIVIATDDSWEATQDGPLRQNDTKRGEHYDASRSLEQARWHAVRPFDWPMDSLVGTRSVPIRERELFHPTVLHTPNGETVLDFGQNMAGYTEFTVSGPAGCTVELYHGEVLDAEGNFTMSNIEPLWGKATEPFKPEANPEQQRRMGQLPFTLPDDVEFGMGRDGIKYPLNQRIRYTLSGQGRENYKPLMSVYGFQYVLLKNWPEPVRAENFVAHAVYSDVEDTVQFSCSDPLINQLYHNTVWSTKSNFVDVPTDCPQRERAGYTGDAQVYIDTGALLMDDAMFYRKWLADLAATQAPYGKVANIAPRETPKKDSRYMYSIFDGSSGWGDACVIVPSVLAKVYADPAFLSENYPMMKGWVDYAIREAKKDDPFFDPIDGDNPYREYLWETGFHWGEWLEPVEPGRQKDMSGFMRGKPEESTAYLYYSSKLLSEAAAQLGQDEDTVYYAGVSAKARLAYQHHCTDHGRIDSQRQCLYVRPLAFGLLEPADEPAAAQALNELVIAKGYHLNTGFLSTPYLCRMLAKYGYEDTALKVLFNETVPGWLYAVLQGCTTVPESWNCLDDPMRPDSSFNHYSYGSVVGWILQYIAGLNTDAVNRHFTIAPHPNARMTRVDLHYRSIVGEIGLSWALADGQFDITLTVPANTTATLQLPGTCLTLTAGTHQYRCDYSL